MTEEIDLKQIVENNDTAFSIPNEDIFKTASVDFLYKLSLVGISSTVDQMGLELGSAAVAELARRSQLAAEIITRLPK